MDSGSCVMNHFIHCKDTHFPPDVQIPVQKNRIFSEKTPLPASRYCASLRCVCREFLARSAVIIAEFVLSLHPKTMDAGWMQLER